MNKLFKTTAMALGLMTLCMTNAFADKKADYQKTYNYIRAMELVKEEKTDEAASFLRKEVEDHKDNGYAFSWLAAIQNYDENYGEALTYVNLAMKYLGKKEEMYAFCLSLRSRIYRALDHDKEALEDLNTCVKLFPKDPDSYENRAEYYKDIFQYELALKDYSTMTQIAAGYPIGYLGSGICLRNLKRYDEAIEQFDYSVKLSSKDPQTYSQRAYCYLLMENYQKSAEDVVAALEMDGNDLAFSVMETLADSTFETMDFLLKVQQMMEPTNSYWPYCRGHIRAKVKRYPEAIELFEASNKLEFDIINLRRIAECRESMCDYAGAIAAANEGLSADSTNVRLCFEKAGIYLKMGRYADAIDGFSRVIELAPRLSLGYSQRGWAKGESGNPDGAIEDYTMAMMVSKEPESLLYFRRGDMYRKKGQADLAKADYEKILEIDSIPSESSAPCYALIHLGELEKAAAAIDSFEVHNESEYYDLACLFALMNDSAKALDNLQKALEDGFSDFCHLSLDSDLDGIRDTDAFKQLVEEYKQKIHERWGAGYVSPESETDAEYDLVTEEIPYTHEGGVTKVRCKINDLPLHFVFDTGASDVTISTVEATFMLKNGYLEKKDMGSNQHFLMADGNISEGTIINLRKVVLGNLVLENVRASVVNTQKAPLLLGQSVLQRLGKIEIDNERSVLKVTQKNKR